MKYHLFFWILLVGGPMVQAQSVPQNPQYDAALALKLKADAYGMKNYYLVILKSGPDLSATPDVVKTSFEGHMRNIQALVKAGKMVVAGPLAKNEKGYRGIFILNEVADEKEAEQLLMQDLAIKNGILAYDLYTWYGSAALPEYLPISDKIWKQNP